MPVMLKKIITGIPNSCWDLLINASRGKLFALPETIKHELTSRSLEFNISKAISVRLVHSIFIPLQYLERTGKKLK